MALNGEREKKLRRLLVAEGPSMGLVMVRSPEGVSDLSTSDYGVVTLREATRLTVR